MIALFRFDLAVVWTKNFICVDWMDTLPVGMVYSCR